MGASISAMPPLNASQDAVVVIPGIMGSSLAIDGRPIWGFERLGWYVRSWSGNALQDLHLTEAEREGQYGRVTATGLLQLPAFAPFLNGLEPYTDLVKAIQAVVYDDAAVLEFPYDWRLPVSYNAGLLAEAAERHLTTWRTHPAYEAGRKQRPNRRPPRLVLVAHSMGGLLVRHLPPELDVRAVVTLGTPWDGAVKAADMLNTGEGAPVRFPRDKLRAMVRTLPGLYDLLPAYRCVDPLTNADPRRLTVDDLVAIGGDQDLAEAALPFQDGSARVALPWPHTAVVGTSQPTASTMSIANGTVTTYETSFVPGDDDAFERHGDGVLVRVTPGGDTTVPLNSGEPVDTPYSVLPQHHGPLAKSKEGLEAVRHVILRKSVGGRRLGTGDLGLGVPDVVEPGEPWLVSVHGADAPLDVRVEVTEEDGPTVADVPRPFRENGGIAARVRSLPPGIYCVSVDGAGMAPVSERVMVREPTEP